MLDYIVFYLHPQITNSKVYKVQDIYSKFMRKNLQEGNLYFAGLRGFSQIKPIHKDIDYMKWLIEKESELLNT